MGASGTLTTTITLVPHLALVHALLDVLQQQADAQALVPWRICAWLRLHLHLHLHACSPTAPRSRQKNQAATCARLATASLAMYLDTQSTSARALAYHSIP